MVAARAGAPFAEQGQLGESTLLQNSYVSCDIGFRWSRRRGSQFRRDPGAQCGVSSHAVGAVITANFCIGLGITLAPKTSVQSGHPHISHRPLSKRVDLVELSLVTSDTSHEPLVEHVIHCRTPESSCASPPATPMKPRSRPGSAVSGLVMSVQFRRTSASKRGRALSSTTAGATT